MRKPRLRKYHKVETLGMQHSLDSTSASTIQHNDYRFPSFAPGTEEHWKTEGASLYKLGNKLRQARSISMKDDSYGGVESRESSVVETTKTQDSLRVFQSLVGTNSRFWGSNGIGFCAYYQKNTYDKYGMYLAVVGDNEIIATQVGGALFSEEEAKKLAPVFVAYDIEGRHEVVFSFLIQRTKESDNGREGSFLVVSKYTIEKSEGIITIKETSNNKLFSKRYLDFEGPLGITRDARGDVLVIGKYKDYMRLSPTDQGYFAWKFKGKDLFLVRPDKARGHLGSYLFRRFVGGSYEHAEKILIWDDGKVDSLSITHIDKYLQSEKTSYATVYRAYNVVIRKVGDGDSKCLIRSLRCGITGPSALFSRNDDAIFMDNTTIGGTRYIFYVSSNGKKSYGQHINMLVFNKDHYAILEDVVKLDFQATSLNLKQIKAQHIGLLLTEKDSMYVHMYEIPVERELLRSDFSILESITVNYRAVGALEFMNSIASDMKLPDRSDVEKKVLGNSEITFTAGSLSNIKLSNTSTINALVVRHMPAIGIDMHTSVAGGDTKSDQDSKGLTESIVVTSTSIRGAENAVISTRTKRKTSTMASFSNMDNGISTGRADNESDSRGMTSQNSIYSPVNIWESNNETDDNALGWSSRLSCAGYGGVLVGMVSVLFLLGCAACGVAIYRRYMSRNVEDPAECGLYRRRCRRRDLEEDVGLAVLEERPDEILDDTRIYTEVQLRSVSGAEDITDTVDRYDCGSVHEF